jgi:hypothetical protein
MRQYRADSIGNLSDHNHTLAAEGGVQSVKAIQSAMGVEGRGEVEGGVGCLGCSVQLASG